MVKNIALSLILSLLSMFSSAFKFRTTRIGVNSMRMMVSTDWADAKLRHEAVSKFLKNADGVQFVPTAGGVNNICDYVTLPSGDKYVLRIYNNGFNTIRVEFEHKVITELAEKRKLSFKLPTPLPNLADGKTHVLLSTGAEACLFEFIPGKLPKKTLMKELGKAAGELVTALEGIDIGLPSPNPRYNELFKAHHATTRENFYAEVQKPDFDVSPDVRRYTDLLTQEIRTMEEYIEKFNGLGLPEQLIHADLHYDNVLVDEGKVSGLLDFEFSAFDWRASELAVCLSKYAGEADGMDCFAQFIDGFADYGKLTEKEINIIPELINLRILANVVYFVGRALAGEDGIEALTSRVGLYYNRVAWIKENREGIIALVKAKVKA